MIETKRLRKTDLLPVSSPQADDVIKDPQTPENMLL